MPLFMANRADKDTNASHASRRVHYALLRGVFEFPGVHFSGGVFQHPGID